MDAALTAVAGTLPGVIARHWFQGRALFRVQPVCDDPEVRRLAEAAFEEPPCTHEAADAQERTRRSDRAKQAPARFVTAAAPGPR
ncbi:hypothetical protein GCM10022244_20740 [Streptomyces gulbargensis]|uniref:Uncharacterized protein n=1 Tax=Streptomyces gulbargensis TaxID=364901 RepID=A0ABP7M2C3_9ACTN